MTGCASLDSLVLIGNTNQQPKALSGNGGFRPQPFRAVYCGHD